MHKKFCPMGRTHLIAIGFTYLTITVKFYYQEFVVSSLKFLPTLIFPNYSSVHPKRTISTHMNTHLPVIIIQTISIVHFVHSPIGSISVPKIENVSSMQGLVRRVCCPRSVIHGKIFNIPLNVTWFLVHHSTPNKLLQSKCWSW